MGSAAPGTAPFILAKLRSPSKRTRGVESSIAATTSFSSTTKDAAQIPAARVSATLERSRRASREPLRGQGGRSLKPATAAAATTQGSRSCSAPSHIWRVTDPAGAIWNAMRRRIGSSDLAKAGTSARNACGARRPRPAAANCRTLGSASVRWVFSSSTWLGLGRPMAWTRSLREMAWVRRRSYTGNVPVAVPRAPMPVLAALRTTTRRLW